PLVPAGVGAPGSARAAAPGATLDQGIRLSPLPRSRDEARALIRSLGPPSRLLTGDEASERFLKMTPLREFGLLHIAAHAVVDEAHPERTAVVLAPGGPEDDGLLQTREIVLLDLRDQVVILSACRSASGAVLAGEGVIGLSRGFFQAGARSVVGSLWTLRDEEAARLVSDLGRRLGEGASVGAALQAARRQRIADREPARAWAGIVLLGDAAAVPFPDGSRMATSPTIPTVAGGFALLVLGLAVIAFALLRRIPRAE
ncbi:MAG TPA: CHAT domain-containing protein, partial [Candidatus Polarisedimenticolia bacterium]|nr:CHAT domain-containing protein [Candidatus Polarisedimenticolia bacterium]